MLLRPMSRFSARLSEISEVCQRTGILTVNDRHTLKQAILDECLEVSDRQVIDRLIQAVRQGSLKLGF